MTSLKNEKWMRQAACRACVDPEIFFDNHPLRAINIYCSMCRVKIKCLEYAERNEIDFGVWGGKTSQERNKVVVLTN